MILCEDAKALPADATTGGEPIVAITALAAAQLDAAGIAYLRVEDFCSEDSLARDADKRFEALAGWARWLDARLLESVDAFRAAGFTPARLHFFHLAWLANALYYRAAAIAALLEHHPGAPLRWYGPAAASYTLGSDLGFWSDPSSLWPGVVEAVGGTLHPAGRAPMVTSAPGPWLQRQRAAMRREGFMPYAKRISRPLVRLAARWAGGGSGAIVFLHHGYDLAALRTELERRGVRCTEWSDLNAIATPKPGDVGPALRAAWDAMAESATLREPFVAGTYDAWPAAQARMRHFVTAVAAEMFEAFSRARTVFAITRPAAMVAPYAEDVWQAPALAAARSLGIPTIIYQHGGFFGACEFPMWRYTDRDLPDHLFVYGDGVRRACEDDDRRHGPAPASVVVVGSARLDRVRRRPRRLRAFRRFTVLYVPDVLRGNLRYLSCNDYPDVSYGELQRRMIAMFREFPSVTFIYKAFNDTVENPALADAAAAPNVRLVRFGEARITRLMWSADLIVLDIPSTGLLECMLTSAPIIAYADHRSIRLRPDARSALTRRCTLAEHPDEFIAHVRAALVAHQFEEVDDPDRSFLNDYGLHLGAGRVVGTAADRVLEIAGRRSGVTP